MFLLTDGTVLVQDLGPTAVGTTNWWRLTPNSSGSYVDGTWSQIASLPSGYEPHAYAAAVLPDGRLAIEGGEQINGVGVWSNLGAIYDPAANNWTAVPPPPGWTAIGDAPSVVLADGRWLLGDSGSSTTDDAIFDPSTLTWTTTGGPGKAIGNAEAGFTLLPSGKVLSVDVLPPACTTRAAEILDPATLEWSSAGTTPTSLVACGNLSEIGPQILMYNGTVFVEGATSATALYDTTNGAWSSGPSFPVVGGQQLNAQDSGAAILPDGKVLVALSHGVFQPPTHFFLFDGTSFTQVPDNTTSSLVNNGNTYMLVLPTGQVLYDTGLGPASLEIFTDPGSPNPAWAPTITSVPSQLAAGETYTLDGNQLNGLSEGAAFGDDYQSSTDYPLVQITNDAAGTVTYARTSAMANRSIAPGAFSCTNFTLPAGIPTGSSQLRVIANGIASTPVQVTVANTGSNTTTCLPTLANPPVVSGVTAVGQLLTSSPGTWNNATSYAYQWQRCAPDGNSCTDISGATASTYRLTTQDGLKSIRSAVTASNGNSTASAVTSSPTAVITARPAVIAQPHITGKPHVGKRLRANRGRWSGPPASYKYQWLRCTRKGTRCRRIPRATQPRYRLTKHDAGHRLRVQVVAINAAGHTRTTSRTTRIIAGKKHSH